MTKKREDIIKMTDTFQFVKEVKDNEEISKEEFVTNIIKRMPDMVKNPNRIYITYTGSIYQVGKNGLIYKNLCPTDTGREESIFGGVISFDNFLSSPKFFEENPCYTNQLKHAYQFFRPIVSFQDAAYFSNRLSKCAISRDKSLYDEIKVKDVFLKDLVPYEEFIEKVKLIPSDSIREQRSNTSIIVRPLDIIVGVECHNRQFQFSTFVRDDFNLNVLSGVESEYPIDEQLEKILINISKKIIIS